MEANNCKFDAIRIFFTNDAWRDLSDYEKQVFCNMKANYDKMSELGEIAETPNTCHVKSVTLHLTCLMFLTCCISNP